MMLHAIYLAAYYTSIIWVVSMLALAAAALIFARNAEWVVLCREDTSSDGTPGAYVLASSKVFQNKETALAYIAESGIARSREPIAVRKGRRT